MRYQDTITMYKGKSSGYGNTKQVDEQALVSAIFIQSTNFIRAGFSENTDADAICYVDPHNAFVSENNYRLEGFYILAPLFDVSDEAGWYRVESVTVNRDHLLTNKIDNVELSLKKTRPLVKEEDAS
jgi:hypothetical protein